MREIMIDLETMGNSQNSVIVSIGAVAFDFDQVEVGPAFYKKVTIDSCLTAGLQFSASTVKWWLTQSEEARKELADDSEAISINEALLAFNYYFSDIVGNRKNTEVNVWGNPASFDLGIISNAYEKCGLITPWHYRNERDLRTLVAFYPELKATQKTIGVLHHPVDDCKTQIAYAKAIYSKLMAGK